MTESFRSNLDNGSFVRPFHNGEVFKRPGFNAYVLIGADEGLIHTLLRVEAWGTHPPKRMLGDTDRQYVVISGRGTFVVDEQEITVLADDVIRIAPGSTYEYWAGNDRKTASLETELDHAWPLLVMLEYNTSPSRTFTDEKI